MKRVKRLFVAFLSVCISISFLSISANADYLSSKTKVPTPTSTRVVKVKYIKDVYSDWKRLNSVFTARRKGETALYQQTKTVKTTSSLNISVPVNQISAKLGYTVEKSKSSTIRGTTSAPLKAKESAAFYYREHWIQYDVTYEVRGTTYTPKTGFKTTISTKKETIKVAQPLNSNDYGWFYAKSSKALGKTVKAKYCDDNYSCKVS